MSSLPKIGKVSGTVQKIDFEWEINDFFSYTREDSEYSSFEFLALNSVWEIHIWPKGRSSVKSSGYISLYLFRIEGTTPETVDLTFSIKTVKHLVENEKKTPWKCDDDGWGWHEFIERSKLEREKANLVPLGNLTIICTLTVKGDNECTFNASTNALASDFKDMFTSKKNTDVEIKVKDVLFSAHKFILVARSPVLAAMFENEMIEKRTGFIDISDCDPEAFRHFLLYLYSGQVDSKECDFYHLYKISDKYDVPALKLMCTDFLSHNISVENVCETYVFGHQFNENELITYAQNFFNDNFEKIVCSDCFLSLMKENCDRANELLKAMAPKVKIEK